MCAALIPVQQIIHYGCVSCKRRAKRTYQVSHKLFKCCRILSTTHTGLYLSFTSFDRCSDPEDLEPYRRGGAITGGNGS